MLLPSAVAALAALALSLAFPLDGDWQAMRLAAPLAAATTTALLWGLLVTRPNRKGWRRGALVGAAAALLAHPLALYFMALWLYATGARDSFGERTADPLEAVLVAGVLSLWSLLLAGVPSAVLGALGGALLGRR